MEENNLENKMVLQEVPEHNFENKIEYMEKTENPYLDEELLEQLRNIKDTAQMDLAVREGYENYNVSNVIYYNKDVELIVKQTKEVEYLNLCVVIAEDMRTGEIIEIYYLDGQEANILELNSKYESSLPIIKLINDTKENLKLDSDKQDEELIKIELVDLEERELGEHEEREEDTKLEEKNDKDDEKAKDEKEKENSLTGIEPRYMVQTIDVDKTYVDNKTTVRKAFKIPPQVKGLAIARPTQEDENVLSNDLTMYMLDRNGKVIEDADGIKINDIFELDTATGKSPITDENTKFELGGYAERNQSHTLRRFKSKENPNLYLSSERNKLLDYPQVYAGRKTMDGNDSVEVQLETRNIPIQTSLEMQKIVAGYKGVYNTENLDKETDELEEKGEDLDRIEEEYEGRVPWDSGRTRK